jgi:hypothetical protein
MSAAQHTGHAVKAWQGLPLANETGLVMVRALFEQAHELAVDAQVEAAAEALHEAARLCSSWS